MTAAELIALLSKAPEAQVYGNPNPPDAIFKLPLVPIEYVHLALNNEANAWVVDLGVREKPTEA